MDEAIGPMRSASGAPGEGASPTILAENPVRILNGLVPAAIRAVEPPVGAVGHPMAEGGDSALLRMLDAAQRFFDCRDRAMVYARWADPPPVRSLAEAIERDCAGFDMERAEAEFRAALASFCGSPAPAQAE